MRENRMSGSMRGCRKRATSRRACALLYGAGPLLRGEPAARQVPAPFAGARRASGVGGSRRPGFPPEGETGKREINESSSLPQAFIPPVMTKYRC